jgi:hypothetical protein
MGDSEGDSDGMGGMGGDFMGKKKKSFSVPKVTQTFKEDDRAKEQDAEIKASFKSTSEETGKEMKIVEDDDKKD